MSEHHLSEAENEVIATRIREELARRRISRQFLADTARISLSTLEKALSGQRPFTLASVVRLQEALHIELRGHGNGHVGRTADVAPDDLGSYARPSVQWIEGDYLTLRPSFSSPQAIYAYRTSIAWDGTKSHLTFRESERQDAAYTQDGDVSIPHQSGYIYLVTNKSGQYRLIVVSKPTIAGDMFGILTTLQSGRGPQLLPVSAPIVFSPLARQGKSAAFGKIEPGHDVHGRYKALIARATEEPFAMFIQSA